MVDALPARPHACPDRVHFLVRGEHRYFRAAPGLAGNRLDLYRAVVNLRHLQLKQTPHKSGVRAGNQNLRPPRGAADAHHVDLDHHALGQLLAGNLLPGGQDGVGGLGTRADVQGDALVSGVNAGDGSGQNLMLF